MSARRRSSFPAEVAAGFALSVAAGALAAALPLVLPADQALRAVVTALGLAAVLRALARSTETTGRITGVAVWAGASAAVWLLGLPLPAYVAVQVAMIWLARSLWLHGRLVEVALDAGLSVLSLCFAAWAFERTGSPFLASWCMFLAQAMHVAIPRTAARLAAHGREERRDELPLATSRGFEDAFGAADEALRRIAARR